MSDDTQLAAQDDYEDFGPRFVSLKDMRQTRALQAVLRGKNIKQACAAAGITYAAWYRWRHEDSEFESMYNNVLVERATRMMEDVDEVENNLIERAKDETDAARVVLRAFKPERYREKQVIEVVSPDVQSRLAQQADAILDVCTTELDKPVAAIVASKLANRLREIWS